MKQRRLAISLPLLALLPACAALQSNHANNGPGMTTTFRNGLKGRSILFDSSQSSGGTRFPNPGFLAPDTNPMAGGKTMGAAPDDRELPEWVEFEWRETIYRADYTYEQLKALPHKTVRVPVRSRVPQDVIAEVMEAKRNREPHKLPEKMLWVYFIWYEDGIKFRWRLTSKCCGERSGGDEITTQ